MRLRLPQLAMHKQGYRAATGSLLDIRLSNLLKWNERLRQGRCLTREQDLRLSVYVHDIGAGVDHWTVPLANALSDQMNPAAAGLRQPVLMLQQLQVAQLTLYLSGGLLRPLALYEWRCRLRQHEELESIVARITAVHVDCAWEAMDAGRHYQALCRHLHALEFGECDPVRRQMLCQDRELLDAVVSIMAGQPGPGAPSELASGVGDAQCRLVLKILLIGSLDARLFGPSDQWRCALLRCLRDAGARARRPLSMKDMALIAFLRDADAAQLRMGLAT